jgi:hypothetical protein
MRSSPLIGCRDVAAIEETVLDVLGDRDIVTGGDAGSVRKSLMSSTYSCGTRSRLLLLSGVGGFTSSTPAAPPTPPPITIDIPALAPAVALAPTATAIPAPGITGDWLSVRRDRLPSLVKDSFLDAL